MLFKTIKVMVDLIPLVVLDESEESSNSCGICKQEKSTTKVIAEISSPNKYLRDDEWDTWIQCEVCFVWFHASCVKVEEYEVSLIKKFHCEKCAINHGSSKMKENLCCHRYLFGDESEINKPVQIGTKVFVDDLKIKNDIIPEVSNNEVIVCEDGYVLGRIFNYSDEWKLPYKVLNINGLDMKVPNNNFTIDDVVELLGTDVVIETIDVYAQHTNLMSLGRFQKLWKLNARDRLYNILSLEFSETPLAEIVRSPALVRELSWVCKYWPTNNNVNDEFDNLSIFNHLIPSIDMQTEHTNSKPFVENFCLLGMKDSYTDFHIDFGGSSVWYHVFKGRKVFYVAAPTDENLNIFYNYQNLSNRSEIFFGKFLPIGELKKLVVEEGETLLIPSGWIHAVWTPVDSLVFGGNFLHSLNIGMQLKIYEMEVSLNIDERFKFPYFELTNWYAAKDSILEIFKDANEEDVIISSYLKSNTKELINNLKVWLHNEKHSKFQKPIIKIFCRTLKDLEREFRKQQQISDRLKLFSPEINRIKSSDEAIYLKLNFTSSSKRSREKRQKKHLKKHKSSHLRSKKKHISLSPKRVIKDNEMPTTSSTVLFINNTNDSKVEDTDPVSNIFTTVSKSMHGRQVKPTSKLFESLEESNTPIKHLLKKEFHSTCKNFMDQFTDEERKIILKAEKAGSCEEKNYECFDDFQIKQTKFKKNNEINFLETSTKSTENRKLIKRPDTVRSRLAKKLKIKF